MKKKIIETITPQERNQELNACINCVYFDYCSNVLPFPIDMENCCDKYKKKVFKNEK